ncbi:MAG: cysteine dioxygenase [Proteobacteria bacterium]|nr:cysteine dioxygenase [Pseudomonadota bacterium]MDA0951955.1 cysteine dioxygenase [Pseudomonadota bacterium]
MTVAEQRSSAIAQTLERIRAIEARDGVSRDSLDAIRAELIALAARRELFPPKEFPLAQGKGERFEMLSVDPDGRFELYLEVADKVVDTLPHNHTTWAVVVGIQGLELNRLYEGEGGEAGDAPLKLREEVPVTAGSGICMMPSDFHSIHMEKGELNLHLHLYGVGFAHMKDRLMFDPASGRYLPYNPALAVVA